MSLFSFFFFFNDTATTEIYTLSLHDALPIWFPYPNEPHDDRTSLRRRRYPRQPGTGPGRHRCRTARRDRKSTRLNSSHSQISYAVFCLKKKKKKNKSYSTILHHKTTGKPHER